MLDQHRRPRLVRPNRRHPDLADVRLIAEPWDATGAYQLGRLFPGFRWMQWNGAYRDTLQKFVKSDPAWCGSE